LRDLLRSKYGTYTLPGYQLVGVTARRDKRYPVLGLEWMATVAKRVWLIATVTALFGLQAPLCALACLEGSVDSAPVASQQEERPCHEESSDSSEPGAPAHEGCGCEIAYDALIRGQTDATSNVSGFVVLVVKSTPSEPLATELYRARWVPTATDLPPPDILLLKSTRII
jgi:hypothetical protein